jgi:hypothetical protein
VPADTVKAGDGGGPLTAGLRRVAATSETRVETIIDRFDPPPAAGDETRSLAADRDLWAVATAVDAAGADTAAFTTDVFRFREDRGSLLPYRALAVGIGARSGGSFMVLAIAMDDASAANAQVERFETEVRTGTSVAARRPWSELVGIERLETRGRVLLAVLTTRIAALWIDLERHPDTLLWWK